MLTSEPCLEQQHVRTDNWLPLQRTHLRLKKMWTLNEDQNVKLGLHLKLIPAPTRDCICVHLLILGSVFLKGVSGEAFAG